MFTNTDSIRGFEVGKAIRVLEQIRNKLRQVLTPERYEHTCRVEKMAVDIAVAHPGEERLDICRVRLAAILHDCGRCFSGEALLQTAVRFGIVIDEVDKIHRILLHAPVGAFVAWRDYEIRDVAVLDAIRYHTTGRPEMSVLEKVIYLADLAEPGRSFAGVEKIREAIGHDLDEALRMGFDMTLNYVIRRGLPIHPLTVVARNHLLATRLGKVYEYDERVARCYRWSER